MPQLHRLGDREPPARAPHTVYVAGCGCSPTLSMPRLGASAYVDPDARKRPYRCQ